MANPVPKHRRSGSKEIIAAQRIIELYRVAFAAHGILTPTHAPSLGDIADAIAGVEIAPRRVLTPEQEAGIDSLIGN